MRIAHVVSTFPPYHGGMGNVAKELAERAAAQGHAVAVITPQQMNNGKLTMDNSEFINSSLSIIHSRVWARFGNAAWCPGIRRALEELQPDIVHLHWPFIGGIAPVLSWRQHDGVQRRRLVVAYHMDLIAGGWKGALFRWYEHRTLPWTLQCADRVVVSSRDYAAHGALAPHMKRLGDRLVEIPFGVDMERFAPHPPPATQDSLLALRAGPTPPLPEGRGETKKGAPVPAKEGGGKTKKNLSPSFRVERLSAFGGRGGGILTPHASRLVVLFVGGLDRAHAFKGVSVLLEAVSRVPTVRLQLVGDGDLRSAYEAQARALGIVDRVTFLGAVSDVDLPAVYRSANVLVLPSTARSEAFGVVLLEAMASGISVIASDLPGVRTVVAHGSTGFLCPPGDAAALAEHLAMLARHPEQARRMGKAARRRVEERYTWDRVMDAWERCYQAV